MLGLFAVNEAWWLPVIKTAFQLFGGYLPWLISGIYVLVVIGLYYGLMFPVWYHIIWTRPEERDLHEQSRFWAWLLGR